MADTSKLAPFDFLVADDVLTAEDVEVEQGTMTHWMQQGLYPMLPWSCVILESAPYQPPRFQLSGVPAEKRFRPAAQPQPQQQQTVQRRMPVKYVVVVVVGVVVCVGAVLCHNCTCVNNTSICCCVCMLTTSIRHTFTETHSIQHTP